MDEIWSINRIEDETAVLESDNGRRMEILAENLPENAKEGDILRRLFDGSMIFDEDETANRRKKNADLFRSLLED